MSASNNRTLKPALDWRHVGLIPARIAHRYEVYPLGEEDGALIIATGNSRDFAKLNELRRLLRQDLIPMEYPSAEIRDALNQHYRLGADVLDCCWG